MKQKICYGLIIISILMACKDSGPTQSGNSSIIGSWTMSAMKIDGVSQNYLEEDAIIYRIDFYTDGSGDLWLMANGQPIDVPPISFDWSTDGNTLTMQITDDDPVSLSFSVNNNTLSLSFTDGSETVEYIYTRQSEENQIVGKWSLNNMKIDGVIWDYTEEDGIPFQIEFLSDGQGNVWLMDYGQITADSPRSFTWSVNGNIVTIEESGGDPFSMSFSVSNNTLTLSMTDGGEIVEFIYTPWSVVTPVENSLIGTWTLNNVYVNGESMDLSEMTGVLYSFEFSEDGSGNYRLMDNGEPTNDPPIPFNWSSDGSSITFEESGIDPYSVPYTLNNNILTLSFIEGDITIAFVFTKS